MRDYIKNIVKHWYFPASGLFFFLVNTLPSYEYIIGSFGAFLVSIVLMSRCESVVDIYKRSARLIKVLSAISSVSILVFLYRNFLNNWYVRGYSYSLPIPDVHVDTLRVMGMTGAMLSMPFVFFFLVLFYDRFISAFHNNNPFSNISKTELIVYSFAYIFFALILCVAYLSSQIFYGTDLWHDLIYTSDSQAIFKDNAYMALSHFENDLRQPLFAVFAMPFVAPFYFLGLIFPKSIQAVIIMLVQIFIMFFSYYMLSIILKLSSSHRMMFMLVSCSTYSFILFSIMPEQYIFAFFYLVLMIYIFSEKHETDEMMVYGASGTLLTSCVMLPFLLFKNNGKLNKNWILDNVKYGLRFIVLIIAFGRFDVFYNLFGSVGMYSTFAGNSASAFERIIHYLSFVRGCFWAPISDIFYTDDFVFSWQLCSVEKADIFGLILIVLALLGFAVNRKKTSSQIFMYWILFSVFILGIIGWGINENGMVLYSLYFGWPFLALIFQLLVYIENKISKKWIFIPVCILTVVMLLVYNINDISLLIEFGKAFYPA